MMNVDVDVQYTLVGLQELENSQHAIIHVAKAGRLALKEMTARLQRRTSWGRRYALAHISWILC